jgi:hypothetical protein
MPYPFTSLNSIVRDISGNSSKSAPSAGGAGPIYNNVRGLLCEKNNPDRVLIFQFNPEEVSDQKETVWEERGTTGFDHTEDIWIRGGGRKINFRLFLDATASSNTMHFNRTGTSGGGTRNPDGSINNPAYNLLEHSIGVMDQVEMLQSFERPLPRDPNRARFSRGGFIPDEVEGRNQFSSPPRLIWVYGNFYLECILSGLYLTYQAFNHLLVPVRAEAQVTLKITEGMVLKTNVNILDRADPAQGLGMANAFTTRG